MWTGCAHGADPVPLMRAGAWGDLALLTFRGAFGAQFLQHLRAPPNIAAGANPLFGAMSLRGLARCQNRVQVDCGFALPSAHGPDARHSVPESSSISIRGG